MSHQPLRLKPKPPLNWETAAPPKKPHPFSTLKQQAVRLGQSAAQWLRQSLSRPAAAQAGLCLCLAGLSFIYAGNLSEDATTVLNHTRELPVYSVERDEKVLAISFDASWGGSQTLEILDILDRHEVKTTFFLVGIWVEKYPDLVKEIVARGHEIGNHSATHPYMTKISTEKMQEELSIMSAQVENLTGVRPTLFRPPYGDYNDLVVRTCRQAGYEVVQWSVDSLDWKNKGTEDIIRRCTQKIAPGDIVLFHNDAQYTPQALPQVLSYYQEQGYRIVPVSQLLLSGPTTIDVQGKQHPARE